MSASVLNDLVCLKNGKHFNSINRHFIINFQLPNFQQNQMTVRQIA